MVSAPRGQAMVETALGTLVFITILMFGIHFAEVGYLTLKVQEASTSALWDTTSAKMHEIPDTSGQPVSAAISAAGGRATSRYKDFDGRSSKTGGAAPVQVFTSAGDLRVECTESSEISVEPKGAVSGVYANKGGMTCTARAVLSPTPRLTRSFLDQGQGSLFQVPHYMAGVIPVCGTGRASSGECKGAFGILLDDWGLEGKEESRTCKVTGCDNKAYFDAAEKVFKAHSTVNGASRSLALSVVGSAPADPAKFYMSFVGMDGNFQDTVPKGENENEWVTTPGKASPTAAYGTAYGNRKKCFLGDECDK